MALNSVSDWSTTPASNVDVGGVGIQGSSSLASGNDAMQTIMAQLKTFFSNSNFTLFSTDAGATAGPVLNLYRNSASPAASDIIGKVLFQGEDSAGNTEDYAEIYGVIDDPTSTSEDASLLFRTKVAGTMTTHMSLTAAGVTVTNGVLSPATNDGSALGTASVSWADLFLASGSVVNFNNGDVTITHSSNLLAFAGGTYTFSGSVTVDSIVVARSAAASVGQAYFHITGSGGTSLAVAGLTGSSAEMYVGTVTAAALNFQTNNTVRGYWTSGGALVVGTGASSGSVNGKTFNADAIESSRSTTGASTHVFFYNPNGTVGSISTSASATAYNTSSDQTLKKNFRPFDAGSLIDAIKIYLFDWIKGGTGYGVKAQEAYNVFPDAITPGIGNNGDKGFQPWAADYSKFVPLLIAEVQDLRRRVAELEG